MESMNKLLAVVMHPPRLVKHETRVSRSCTLQQDEYLPLPQSPPSCKHKLISSKLKAWHHLEESGTM